MKSFNPDIKTIKQLKRIFLLILVVFIGCKDDKYLPGKACSTINSFEDTLIADNYKLHLIALTSSNIGSLEIPDQNNNQIRGSGNFSINLVQLSNGNNCWETNVISTKYGISPDVYSATYNDIPNWAHDSNTKVIIQLTISGIPYYLIDSNMNN